MNMQSYSFVRSAEELVLFVVPVFNILILQYFRMCSSLNDSYRNIEGGLQDDTKIYSEILHCII